MSRAPILFDSYCQILEMLNRFAACNVSVCACFFVERDKNYCLHETSTAHLEQKIDKLCAQNSILRTSTADSCPQRRKTKHSVQKRQCVYMLHASFFAPCAQQPIPALSISQIRA